MTETHQRSGSAFRFSAQLRPLMGEKASARANAGAIISCQKRATSTRTLTVAFACDAGWFSNGHVAVHSPSGHSEHTVRP